MTVSQEFSTDSAAAETRPQGEWVWPSGCQSPNSCLRHRACMYIKCPHEGRDITAQTLTAALTTPEQDSEIERLRPGQLPPYHIAVSLQLVEAMVCVLRAMEKTTNRVDDWRLDDMRAELSANLVGKTVARSALKGEG